MFNTDTVINNNNTINNILWSTKAPIDHKHIITDINGLDEKYTEIINKSDIDYVRKDQFIKNCINIGSIYVTVSEDVPETFKNVINNSEWIKIKTIYNINFFKLVEL